MINFNVPPFVGREETYIAEAIKNRKLCGDGEFTKKCNRKLEEMTGAAKVLLTTSCTHATEMAALLSDIQRGDEVIMPSYTFVSTADAFVLRGATVVFVDIRRDTAPVVLDGCAAVLVQFDLDARGIAVGSLVNGIVDDLPKDMMQPLDARRTDVHARPQADRVQPFEYADIFRTVFLFGHRFLLA